MGDFLYRNSLLNLPMSGMTIQYELTRILAHLQVDQWLCIVLQICTTRLIIYVLLTLMRFAFALMNADMRAILVMQTSSVYATFLCLRWTGPEAMILSILLTYTFSWEMRFQENYSQQYNQNVHYQYKMWTCIAVYWNDITAFTPLFWKSHFQ